MIPISKDLRIRVIKYLEKDCNYAAASRKFDVSESSVRRWHRKYISTGSVLPKPFPGKKPRLQGSEFKHYVDNHPGSTLAQIGNHFKMTARGAHYYMKKFGYSFKKKRPDTWKQSQSKDFPT